MLDKSVPYAKLIMCRKAGTPIPEFPLPDGFKFTFYSDGDDKHWARIETSVGEFDSEFSALMLFRRDFIPHIDELYRRCLFIENKDEKKIATANAWWATNNNNRLAWLHWVSVDPNYQGLGLGKAVSAQTTRLMCELEGDVDIYLSTQTWSYKAIDIYKKCGYEPTDEKALYGPKSKNDYKKALKILAKLQKKHRRIV